MLAVAIVEDNDLAATLLKDYLEGDDIGIVARYRSGEEAVETIPTLPLPDIVLMDLGLPGMSGIEATELLKNRFPELEIVIQTVFEDGDSIMKAIRAGASGYLLKASSREEIIKALREVKAGGSPLSGRIARKILSDYRDKPDVRGEKESTKERFSLTDREKTILDSLIAGGSYKEIASELGISIHTVNNHLRKVYEKMRVNSRSEAVARVMRG